MSNKVGSVYIEIQAKMGSLEKDLKQLEARLQNTDQKGKEVSSSLMSMGKIIGGSLITGAVIGLGTAALKASAQMEQNRVAFTTMLGSASKANKLLQDMTNFAASTPFQLTDIVEAGKALTAFGISSEKIIPTLTQLGDISSALNIPIKELSDLYGKAKVQGTLYAEDLNQLAGRGIPIFTELGKVMDVDASQIKKLGSEGKITFDKLEQAITNMTAEGSQFGGLMAAQAETLGGQWSNFEDNLSRTATTLGDKLAPAAKAVLGTLNLIMESDTSAWQRNMQSMVRVQEEYAKAVKAGTATEERKKEILEYEKINKIIVPINASAEERLEIYKKIAIATEEEAQNMGLVQRSEMANLLLLDQHKNKILEIADAYRKANPNLDPANKDKPSVKTGSGKSKEDEANKKAYESRLVWLEKEADMVAQYGSIEMANFIADLESKAQAFQQYSGVLTNMSSSLAQLSNMSAQNQTAEIDNRLTKEMDAIEEKYAREKELIEESALTEEEKNAKLKALDEQKARDEKAVQDKANKEKRKIARENAKIQKDLAIFETLITTPMAAMEAFSALAGIPIVGPALGAAAAAATTALGLAKIKLIKDQPLPALAEGGIVPAVPGGNQFTIGEAGSAEAVIPLNDNTLSRLANMINSAGGDNGQLIQVTVTLDGNIIYTDLYKATKDGRATISRNGVVA